MYILSAVHCEFTQMAPQVHSPKELIKNPCDLVWFTHSLKIIIFSTSAVEIDTVNIVIDFMAVIVLLKCYIIAIKTKRNFGNIKEKGKHAR